MCLHFSAPPETYLSPCAGSVICVEETGSQRSENTQRETKQDQPRETLPNRRTYRSPQEQRLVDAACAVFEDTRRHLNAAARPHAFSAFR